MSNRAVGALTVIAVLAAACGTTLPTGTPVGDSSASASALGPGDPTGPPEPGQNTPVPSAISGSADPAPPGPPLPAGVTVDPGLLEVLPASIEGVPLLPDPATAEQIAGDPLLAESALSIAVALAVIPAASGAASGEDLAVASVIRLRPDVFDDAFYEEWRHAYDEAACDAAGGVEAEQVGEIAGRPTFIATCTGGALTYHTYLVDQGFLVSVTATGERHLGELILAEVEG